MKELLLLCLMGASVLAQAQQSTTSTASSVYAQSFGPKGWLIGAQGGYSSKGIVYSNNLTTQVYGGYFITKKLLVGLSGAASQERFLSIRDRTYSIGPMVRYQFMQSRVSPFVVASYQFGQHIVTGYEILATQVSSSSNGTPKVVNQVGIGGSGVPESIHSRSVGVGLSVGITRFFRFDLALVGQNRLRTKYPAFDEPNFIQGQIGLNYQFPSR